MMEQFPSSPLWADDMNLWFDDNDLESWLHWRPALPWQAMWIEHRFAKDAASAVRWWGADHRKPDVDGRWRVVRAVGRFVAVRCLPSGPNYKLSEWDRLDPGRAILCHPEPNDSAISQVEARACYMRSHGRGRFKIQHRDDGALWVARFE